MVTANWRGCEGASHWKGNQYTHARRSRSSQLSALIAALFEESRQKVMAFFDRKMSSSYRDDREASLAAAKRHTAPVVSTERA